MISKADSLSLSLLEASLITKPVNSMEKSSPSPRLPPSNIPVLAHDGPTDLERNIQQLEPKENLLDVSELGLISSEKSSSREAEDRPEPLSKIFSNVSNVLRPVDITSDPGPPPDGGKRAWTQGESSLTPILRYSSNPRYGSSRLISLYSHCRPHGCSQYMGLHQLVWCFSDLLH